MEVISDLDISEYLLSDMENEVRVIVTLKEVQAK
jgi:hypothetical protein